MLCAKLGFFDFHESKNGFSCREFTVWLTSTLQERAIQYGCSHRFDKEPKVMFHTTPGNEEEVRMVYSTIHSDHPEVMVVFHILPAPNSIEYKLMKELTEEYDLIRQGVLLEKAITYFEGCDVKEVLGNMLQWFNRRFSQLVALEKKTVTKFSLRIGEGGKHTTNVISFPMNNINTAVQKVLHGKDDDVSKNININGIRFIFWMIISAKASIHVFGYPSSFNEFEIANIFNHFRVAQVVKNLTDGAIVEFVNEIHAAQAAIEYDQSWIDSIHSLTVTPIHPEVIKEVKTAIRDENILCQSISEFSPNFLFKKFDLKKC
uniref:RRM domain-containing protein n=1 Tax=Elaeophora elaphi TaxID=1147741 RepID=A0A0R3RHJ5_9BILA